MNCVDNILLADAQLLMNYLFILQFQNCKIFSFYFGFSWNNWNEYYSVTHASQNKTEASNEKKKKQENILKRMKEKNVLRFTHKITRETQPLTNEHKTMYLNHLHLLRNLNSTKEKSFPFEFSFRESRSSSYFHFNVISNSMERERENESERNREWESEKSKK